MQCTAISLLVSFYWILQILGLTVVGYPFPTLPVALQENLIFFFPLTHPARNLDPSTQKNPTYETSNPGIRKHNNTGVYFIAAVIGAVLLFALVYILHAAWIRCSKRRQRKEDHFHQQTGAHRSVVLKQNGNYVCLPVDGDTSNGVSEPSTIFTSREDSRDHFADSQPSRPRTRKEIVNRHKQHVHDAETAATRSVIGFWVPPITLTSRSLQDVQEPSFPDSNLTGSNSNAHVYPTSSKYSSSKPQAKEEMDDDADLSLLSRCNSYELGDDEASFSVRNISTNSHSQPALHVNGQHYNITENLSANPSRSSEYKGAFRKLSDAASHRSFFSRLELKERGSGPRH